MGPRRALTSAGACAVPAVIMQEPCGFRDRAFGRAGAIADVRERDRLTHRELPERLNYFFALFFMKVRMAQPTMEPIRTATM